MELAAQGTYKIGTDCYPFSLLDNTAKTAKVVLWYAPRKTVNLTLRKNGVWREAGKDCGYYVFGEAVEYLDPDF